jgi:hypothetical protein
MGITSVVRWKDNLSSSTELSSLFGSSGRRRGEKNELGAVFLQILYIIDLVDLFPLPGSTDMLTIQTTLSWILATLSSSRLMSLSAWTWCGTVGHPTMVLMGLNSGWGTMQCAFADPVLCLQILHVAGWIKCPLAPPNTEVRLQGHDLYGHDGCLGCHMKPYLKSIRSDSSLFHSWLI